MHPSSFWAILLRTKGSILAFPSSIKLSSTKDPPLYSQSCFSDRQKKTLIKELPVHSMDAQLLVLHRTRTGPSPNFISWRWIVEQGDQGHLNIPSLPARPQPFQQLKCTLRCGYRRSPSNVGNHRPKSLGFQSGATQAGPKKTVLVQSTGLVACSRRRPQRP